MLVFKLKADHRNIPLSKRDFNNAVKGTHKDLGRYWHGALRPKHFTAAGAREYGYAPREGEKSKPGPRGFGSSYTGKKLKKWGHTKPLVWSGESKRRTQKLNLRPTSKRITIKMNAPALNFQAGKRTDLNMRRELETISDRETVGGISRMYQRLLDRHLARANRNR